jgi:hypothetical protein
VKASDWRDVIVSIIDGVVARSTSDDARVRLEAFRNQAIGARTSKARTRCETELESYLQSTAQLRATAKRSLAPKVEAAVDAAITALAKAEYALGQIKKNA